MKKDKKQENTKNRDYDIFFLFEDGANQIIIIFHSNIANVVEIERLINKTEKMQHSGIDTSIHQPLFCST